MSKNLIKAYSVQDDTIIFDRPVIIEGAHINDYKMPVSLIPYPTIEKSVRYAIENIFREYGFFRARFDGVDAKKKDQLSEPFEDFIYANVCVPDRDFWPTEDQILENAKIPWDFNMPMQVGPIIGQLTDLSISNLKDQINRTRAIKKAFYADIKKAVEAEKDSEDSATVEESSNTDAASSVNLLKGRAKLKGIFASKKEVAESETPKQEELTSAVQPPVKEDKVSKAEDPKQEKKFDLSPAVQPPVKEDKIAKTAAPWTRPMTPVDETGKPAPEENAPQMTQQVGINVIPNAKPVEQPKAEKPKVNEPIYDENQDLKAILPGNKVWEAVLKEAEGKALLNTIGNGANGILTVCAFGKGSKKYMPEKSFYLDLGRVLDGNAKIFPIVPQDKLIEDKDFAVVTADDMSNLSKFLKNGRIPAKEGEEKALREELQRANHFVELSTLGKKASLVEFAKLINSDQTVQDHVKKYGGARFRVTACDSELNAVTLIMDMASTASVLHGACGPAQAYQAVLIKGQPTQINYAVVAA